MGDPPAVTAVVVVATVPALLAVLVAPPVAAVECNTLDDDPGDTSAVVGSGAGTSVLGAGTEPGVGAAAVAAFVAPGIVMPI